MPAGRGDHKLRNPCRVLLIFGVLVTGEIWVAALERNSFFPKLKPIVSDISSLAMFSDSRFMAQASFASHVNFYFCAVYLKKQQYKCCMAQSSTEEAKGLETTTSQP